MTEKRFDQTPLPAWIGRFEKVQINPEDAWYEVFKLMDGIYAIFEPYNIQMVISYLIVGENRAMLFDTGMGISPINRVVKQLTDKPIFVVISHSHFDHIGGAHLFSEVWAVDEPNARRNAAGAANKYLQLYSPPDTFLESHIPAGFDPSAYKINKYTPSNFLVNRLRFDLGGRILEIYFAPGHSPDSIVMFDRTNRLLWTGDTFYVGQLFAYLEDANMHAYTQTAAVLGVLADYVDYLLPSHNTTLEPSSWLVKMASAFIAISEGEDIPHEDKPDYREYQFDGFSIMAKYPLGT
jgi:glyoxylase-like metal-dependent hydrolase (beta-lactamase superfamily II)